MACDSSQIAGAASFATTAKGRAASNPHDSARCIANRFGANSPNTSVNRASTRVIRKIAVGRAAPPRNPSGPINGSANETAAVAEARNPARVMPI